MYEKTKLFGNILNEIENKTYQSLWDAAKAALGGKFTAFNAHIIKEKRPKVSDLSFHLKKLEKEEHINSNQAEKRKNKNWSRNQ